MMMILCCWDADVMNVTYLSSINFALKRHIFILSASCASSFRFFFFLSTNQNNFRVKFIVTRALVLPYVFHVFPCSSGFVSQVDCPKCEMCACSLHNFLSVLYSHHNHYW